MQTLRTTSWLSTNLHAGLNSAQTITFVPAGKPGGFGSVHNIQTIDGKPVTGLIIKLLTHADQDVRQQGFDTIQELQRRLEQKQRECVAKGTTLFEAYPALVAVPIASFQGTVNGRPVLGCLANDMFARGMTFFGDLLEDPDGASDLQQTPLELRMSMAEQLVSAFSLLQEINFIHADLKPDALFVDLNQGSCALIDFDGGRVVSGPKDTPTTFGTKQPWLAPEVLKQLCSATLSRIHITLLADQWSVCLAVAWLLTGVDPLFFLHPVSSVSITDYNAHYEWPDAGPQTRYFNAALASKHAHYKEYVDAEFPAALRKLLQITLQSGYLIPKRRTTFYQWGPCVAVAP